MDPIFQKLAAEEQKFFNTQFFAPVFSEMVKVKIANIIVDFKVEPANFRGWGIFNVAEKNKAIFNRDANLIEIGQYLENFDRTTFIVCDNDRMPLGISASEDKLYTVDLTPFFLANNINLFEKVFVRFDGTNYIFERVDYRSSVIASRLREELEKETKIENLNINGLSKFERVAYALVSKMRDEKKRLSTDGRLRSAIERGGGQFHSYRRNGGNLSVTFSVDGHTYTSTITENFGVVSAGICLSGTDRQFDLQSLMTVIREGQNRRRIHRM